MFSLLIAVLAGVGFLIAYHTYGHWLGHRIFVLSVKAVCPANRLEDGVDFVPTSKGVVFGHHFTSIAGTGPIVGPAIAIMWGWLPALLWVVFGSIFIGAVHDLGALVVSLRNNGQTIGDIAGRVLNRRVRWLFLLILMLSLTIMLAIFGLVIASVFKLYPAAIFPCLIQIPLAVAIGYWLHRRGADLLLPSILALGVMYLTVFYGDYGVLGEFNQTLAGWSAWTWVVVLLLYSYVASVLPVWTLLQPRDYINYLQLVSVLGLILLGLLVAALFGGAPVDAGGIRPALEMAAPAINLTPVGAPPIFPFIFITIACGAISGFHCLVSSGTSSKQLTREPEARFVGYGSMLVEGFLAVLVILACAAGLGLGLTTDQGLILTGEEAWSDRYASWSEAGSLGAKVGAFVQGAANFLQALGFSSGAAIALMSVFVASFAGTTLDTACRLQRYVIQEFLRALFRRKKGISGLGIGYWLNDRHGATILAVLLAAGLAATPQAGQEWSLQNAGKGGLILWPLFGATNQLLAGLAFLVIAFYLWRSRRSAWFLALPMAFMMIMPFWTMLRQVFFGYADQASWWSDGKVLLCGIGLATMALEVWMIVEAIRLFPGINKVIDELAAKPNEVEGTVGVTES